MLYNIALIFYKKTVNFIAIFVPKLAIYFFNKLYPLNPFKLLLSGNYPKNNFQNEKILNNP